MTVRCGVGLGVGEGESEAEGVPDVAGLSVGVDGVGVARFSEASGRRSTKRTMTTITDPTISSHLTDDLMRSPTSSFALPRLPRPR
jgi:hypothetical protein